MKRNDCIVSVSKEEAKKLLEPHESMLNEIMAAAWQKFEQLPTEVSYPMSTRTRASLMSDYMCEQIKHSFQCIQGVSVLQRQFLMLNFSDRLLMRFKMFDKYLCTSNIQTKYQRDYNGQLVLPTLPPAAARIVAGYQLDRDQTKIKDICIAFFVVKKAPIWSYSILKAESGVTQLPLEVDEPVRTSRVKAKNIRKANDE